VVQPVQTGAINGQRGRVDSRALVEQGAAARVDSKELLSEDIADRPIGLDDKPDERSGVRA
ncbi:MAG TPA: hypothetical protein VNC17_14525, partial [Thermoleophilaceae bacterium]|nr:hypothetical protein [Thermoleophilaceae bacterium]